MESFNCRAFLDIQFLILVRQDIKQETLMVPGFKETHSCVSAAQQLKSELHLYLICPRGSIWQVGGDPEQNPGGPHTEISMKVLKAFQVQEAYFAAQHGDPFVMRASLNLLEERNLKKMMRRMTYRATRDKELFSILIMSLNLNKIQTSHILLHKTQTCLCVCLGGGCYS